MRENRVVFNKVMEDAQSDVILYWGARHRRRYNDIFENLEYDLIGIVSRWPKEHKKEMETVEYVLKDSERGIIWSVEPGTFLFEELQKIPRPFWKIRIPTLRGKRLFCVQPLTSNDGITFRREIEIVN